MTRLSNIGSSVTFKLEGGPRIAARLKKYKRWYPKSFAAALYAEGFDLAAKSAQMVPIDQHILRPTLYVSKPKNLTHPVVEVGYNTYYAIYVHENKRAHHEVGTWGYLEKPFKKQKVGFKLRLLQRTRSFMKNKRWMMNSTYPSYPPIPKRRK